MEKTTRRHLNTENLTALQEEDINKLLTDAISQDAKVVRQWQDLTGALSGCEIEEDKKELLQEVIQLWITVRAHSFVEGCNSIFHKCFERGTRKTLKSVGTEKAV